MKIPLAPADPLGEALHFLRISGVMYCRSEFTAPWALSLSALEDCLMFHVVTSGRCVLEVKGSDDHVLQPGDFALVPHGAGHQLSSEPGVPAAKLFDLAREQVSDRYEILRHGGGGAPTTVICGAARSDARILFNYQMTEGSADTLPFCPVARGIRISGGLSPVACGIQVTADSWRGQDLAVFRANRALTKAWMGDVRLADAMRSGLVRVEGPSALVRAFPGWLALSGFADVERPRGGTAR